MRLPFCFCFWAFGVLVNKNKTQQNKTSACACSLASICQTLTNKHALERLPDFVVAPYEADAQLAYLARIGLVDAVITEDSDLIAFGVREVLLKMDGTGLVLLVLLV